MEEILLRRAEAGDALLLTELRKTVLIAANRGGCGSFRD